VGKGKEGFPSSPLANDPSTPIYSGEAHGDPDSCTFARSIAAAAAGDPIPSAAYTVDGRAGLRNPASPDPVRERGE